MHRYVYWTAIVLACLGAFGCSALSSSQSSPQGATLSGNATLETPAPAYEFTDVRIPGEMKLQSDDSFIMQTPQVKAGALVYTGWVDPTSLSSFYLREMPEAGWSPLSYFKYGHHLMVFEKPEKVCVIRIHKGHFSTRLEIWVSPAVNQDGSEFSERVLSQ
ncbi:hypothetical protein [Desulfovermiculus halophilus]|jgi:hypothetical protein|uniref:hypothetical protein n=1 Tax=Desulfovermiculus halophilus TaxID=339722 RepID=UPI000482A97E|nr:hypothetical protein [Desulfovermiculus halophilus]